MKLKQLCLVIEAHFCTVSIFERFCALEELSCCFLVIQLCELRQEIEIKRLPAWLLIGKACLKCRQGS